MNTHASLLGSLTPQQFIDTIWQQQPWLIRNALPAAIDIVDGNDLAGIACEPDSDARLVISTPEQTHWQCESAPFKSKRFKTLPTSHWTLLVQSVDHWIPEVQALLQHFLFLPRWRLDDIMISYAVDGGGVGPHFDYYDVFLIQASGQRRWQTGQRCDENSALREGEPLRLLQDFHSENDQVLVPGDMLYVPAGLAHWGTAVGDDCITVSVGFRAASQRELLQTALENIAETLPAHLRYTDTPSAITADSFCINDAAIDNLLTLWDTLPRDTIRTALADALGELATETQHSEDKAPEKNLTRKSLQKYLQSNTGLRVEHHPASRFSYRLTEAGNATLYVDGGTLHTTAALAKAVCHGCITAADCSSDTEQQLALALVNQGSLLLI
jgi:50S ribosomal protein L16 3-hydroxylase